MNWIPQKDSTVRESHLLKDMTILDILHKDGCDCIFHQHQEKCHKLGVEPYDYGKAYLDGKLTLAKSKILYYIKL